MEKISLSAHNLMKLDSFGAFDGKMFFIFFIGYQIQLFWRKKKIETKNISDMRFAKGSLD